MANTNIKKASNDIQDITVADILSQFDGSLRLLLERNYFDNWNKELTEFDTNNTRLDWNDAFFGFKLLGMRHYDKKEYELALQNIENVLSIFRDGSHSFITTIDGKKEKSEVAFLTCKRKQADKSISTKEYAKLMQKSWQANFPGSVCENISLTQYDSFSDDFEKNKFIGVMTGIPGRKKPEEGFFAQGIERFLDTVTGLDYKISIVAEPVLIPEMNKIIDQILNLKNEIGRFHKATLNESSTLSESLTKTVGMYGGGSTSDSSSRTYFGKAGAALAVAPAAGAAAGAIAPLIVVAAPALAVAMPVILAGGALAAIGTVAYKSLKGAWALFRSTTHTTSKMGGGFASLSKGKTTALTKGQAREIVNYAAENSLKILDEYLERLKYARSYGMWKTGIYLSAPDKSTYMSVKNAMIAQFSGENSSLEPLRFIDLDFKRESESEASAKANKISFAKEVIAGYNPELTLFSKINKELNKNGVETISKHPLGDIFNGLYTPMTTGELAILTAPPQRECRAVSVTERGAFGGKKLQDFCKNKNNLTIGEPLYYGNKTGESLSIPFNEITRHVFVTGTTGSGKTNTVKNFCKQFSEADIPWLVIEPGIKTEYKNLKLKNNKQPLHFSLGIESEEQSVGIPFRLNPFYFPKGISLLTHVDRLKTSFNAAFPMYASMPYILEEAILDVYKDLGWNILDGSNRYSDNPWEEENGELLFPILSQLYERIDAVVISKNYDIRLQLDISAALKARISSLLQGGKGEMLNTHQSFPMKELMKNPVVMDMAGIGSNDEKALIMAFLFNSIFEHASLRKKKTSNNNPAHILIIEEAHNLLKNTSQNDNPEVANIKGAAVEQFATMLAELRALSQGIVIVDQIPTKLIPDVIKNSNLKIVHQLCSSDDRNIVGDSMLLDEKQKNELGRLNRMNGEAAVYHPLWEKTYGVSIEEVTEDNSNINENKTEIISKYKNIYGKNPFSKIRITNQTNKYLSKILYGLAFNDLKMIRSGLIGIQEKPISIATGLNDKNSILNFLKRIFEDSIIEILKVSGGKLSLISECPAKLNGLAENILADKNVDKIFKNLNIDFEEIENIEVALSNYAAKKYIESEKLNSTVEKIGQKFSGEEAYEKLRNKIKENVKNIVGYKYESYSKKVEESLTEQLFLCSGFIFSGEMIEMYKSRFLN